VRRRLPHEAPMNPAREAVAVLGFFAVVALLTLASGMA
jgi:hypothetical protein